VHILNAGVGEAKAVAKVFGGGAAATAVQAGLIGGALHQEHEIQLASIDDIVVENQLKPGLIKFDIEGMESAAIRGAALTLARYRPILLISVYHTPEDFLYIKPFIESLGLGYSFRLEHHNPFDPIYETVLVCVPSAAAWKG
jgi:hypothetical protein